MMGIPPARTSSSTTCVTPGCHCRRIYLTPPRCTCNECK